MRLYGSLKNLSHFTESQLEIARLVHIAATELNSSERIQFSL